MKKLFMIALIGSFSSLMIGCQNNQSEEVSESETDPIEYNDGIVDLQMHITRTIVETMQLNGEDVIANLKGAIATTEKGIDSLKSMEVYPGGEEIKDKAIALSNYYLKSLKGPMMEAFVLYTEKGEDMNEEDSAQFLKLYSALGDGEGKYIEALTNAQNAFASANDFKIEEETEEDTIDVVEN